MANKKRKKPKPKPKKILIADELLVKCPWCTGESTVKEWNDNTFENCKTREMKRDFRSLNDKIAWSTDQRYYFKCPICSNWCGGYNLKIVNASNEELLNLGNKPVIDYIKNGSDVF